MRSRAKQGRIGPKIRKGSLSPRTKSPVEHRELTARPDAIKLGIDFFSAMTRRSRRVRVFMTIRVELNPEMQRQLAAETLARGIALELYAQRL